MRAQPSSHFGTPRPSADPRTGAPSATRQSLLEYALARRGLLSGILESVGGFLGFGNNQARPNDQEDTGSGAPSSIGGNQEPTSVKPPVNHHSSPAQAPPASYPAPGGGGQGERPTSSASIPPASVSPASSSSAGSAPHSTTAPDAMNVAPTPSTTPPTDESQHVSDIYGGTATSHTASSGWPSDFSSVSSAPSPTDPPTTAAHEQRFPLSAAAAIGAVLGFLAVSALFWAVWLALRKRRRSYPEFASVHPKWVSAPESVGGDENPFTHPRDEKEDDPFDAASLCRASTTRSLASTLSV